MQSENVPIASEIPQSPFWSQLLNAARTYFEKLS